VFDSKGTIDDVAKYNTFVLVNQTNILIKSENGKVEANPIGNLPEGTLTRANVDQFFVAIEGYAKYVPGILELSLSL
jgi:hypothetical protein